jgi:hypothetical protein
MRISDDRYSRDRLRLDLAFRLIRHEARTRTIRTWTGLSEDRVRKLFHTYLEDPASVRVHRHRGKSPRQPAYFLRSPRVQQHAAVFASLCCLFGLVRPIERSGSPAQFGTKSASVRSLGHTLPHAELLCFAYEAYRAIAAQPAISFEHAAFLANVLTNGRDLALRHCAHCRALVVTDVYGIRVPKCTVCAAAPPRR